MCSVQLAPTVRAIAANSPNRNEFSIKIEDEEGRREEVYLGKQVLVNEIAVLAPEFQAVFDPLELTPERTPSQMEDLFEDDLVEIDE